MSTFLLILYFFCIAVLTFVVCYLNCYCFDTPRLKGEIERNFIVSEPDIKNYILTDTVDCFKEDLREFICYEERLKKAQKYNSYLSGADFCEHISYIIMFVSLLAIMVKHLIRLNISHLRATVISGMSAVVLVSTFYFLSHRIYKWFELPSFKRNDSEIKKEFNNRLCRVAYGKLFANKEKGASLFEIENDFNKNIDYYLSVVYNTTPEKAHCFYYIEYTLKKIEIHNSYLKGIENSLYRRYIIAKIYCWAAFILYVLTFGLPLPK